MTEPVPRFVYTCQLCGQETITIIGLKAHWSTGHSLVQRIRHWLRRHTR